MLYFMNLFFSEAEMAQDWDFKKQATGFDIAEQIKINGICSKTRAFLEEIRTGEESAAFKKQVMSEFFFNVAQSERAFEEEEKDVLFAYFREFSDEAGQGFLFSDRVLARLVKENDGDRNAEIVALTEKLEKAEGFLEETAAKLVTVQPDLCGVSAKRAMELCQESDKPNGVVFALALLEQNQVKLAVKLLIELSKKGAATAALMYLGRILARAKGAEKLLADMLLVNLSRLTDLELGVLREYTATLYLSGAEAFYDNGAYLEAARILRAERISLLINGNERLEKKYGCLVDGLISKDKRFESVFLQKHHINKQAVKPDIDKQAVKPVDEHYKAETVEKTEVKEKPLDISEVQKAEPETDNEQAFLSVRADVLKITSAEVEQHFEKIKRLSKEAIAKAEAQAKRHAENVSNSTIKLKKLAGKIKFFKKSDGES